MSSPKTWRRPEATCRACGRPVPFDTPKGKVEQVESPRTCGRVECRARGEWNDAQWAAHALFAEIRRECGLPLSKLSIEALHRTGAEL